MPNRDGLRSSVSTQDARKARYNRLHMTELQLIAAARGIKLKEVLVDALLEQDRSHVEHPFPFLLLPAEVRNRIYAYVVVSSIERDLDRLKLPDLLRVSSQIRRESLGVFFGFNTLRLDAHRYYHGPGKQRPYQYLSPWTVRQLDRISPHLNHLRKVHISGFVWLRRQDLQQYDPCSMTLALERCVNRMPQYVARMELLSHATNNARIAGFSLHAGLGDAELRERSIETNVQDSVQACLDRHVGSFTFSARNIDALLDTACFRFDVNDMLVVVTPSNLV